MYNPHSVNGKKIIKASQLIKTRSNDLQFFSRYTIQELPGLGHNCELLQFPMIVCNQIKVCKKLFRQYHSKEKFEDISSSSQSKTWGVMMRKITSLTEFFQKGQSTTNTEKKEINQWHQLKSSNVQEKKLQKKKIRFIMGIITTNTFDQHEKRLQAISFC